MPAHRKAYRPRDSERDREFEELLRSASRLKSTPQPVPRSKAPRSRHGKPV